MFHTEKSQQHKMHIWFFANKQANSKKTKRAFSCQRSQNNIENKSCKKHLLKGDINENLLLLNFKIILTNE